MQAPDPATTVHVGRDGWLFLIGGTNSVLIQYRRLSWHFLRIWAWTRLIRQRSARAQALGIRCVQTIVPEKLSIYDDRTDGLRYDPARSPARRLARRLMGLAGFVDLVAPLRAARDDAELYRRTDTHWSYEGCHVAYRALMRACGAVPLADVGSRPHFTTEGVWDLGEKLPEPPVEKVTHWTLDRNAVRAWASPRIEALEAAGRIGELHVGAHVIYQNASPDADPRTLMLFGDSCAQFTRTLLTGFLAESFAELHFIWSSSIDWTHVARVRPDILMFEMAERFMARIPVDDFDVEAADRVPTDLLMAQESAAAE